MFENISGKPIFQHPDFRHRSVLLVAKYNKMFSKNIQNDQIHVENVQGRHFRKIKQPTSNDTGGGGWHGEGWGHLGIGGIFEPPTRSCRGMGKLK